MINTNTDIRLGIDFGRVIVQPGDERSDTSFLNGSVEQAMKTPPYPGVMETVADLVHHFSGKVWIVSKAGTRTQEKSRLWLDHHRFWQRTGMRADHLVFCRKRHEKAIHANRLGLTHFIDDRLDVLSHLRDLVSNLYLFGDQKQKFIYPQWVKRSDDWSKIRNYFGL